MKTNIVLAVVFLALFTGLDASPLLQETNSVAVRQAAGTCQSQADCLPANLTGYTVSTDLVSCSAEGICQCTQSCFILNGIRCGYSSCGWYGPNSTICTPINQKSQLAAFLLTWFLSNVGAANFYIGQNGLGGGQLALLLSPILFCVISCICGCVSGCLGCEKGGAVIGAVVPIVLISVLTTLAITAWWIADLVIFGNNSRLDGNGCPLKSVF